MTKNFDAIIVTADEPFGQMWHTQIVFTNFLSQNNKVIYVGPPTKWNPLNLLKKRSRKTKVSDNLIVIDYPNQFPSSQNSKNDELLCKEVSIELETIGAKNVLVWHFDSFRSGFAHDLFIDHFNVKRIYHVIDPFYHNPLNKWLSENCDVLVLTSPRNQPHYADHSKKVMVVAQALDVEQDKKYLNEATKEHSSKYAVLLGTISDFVDIEWLIKMFKGSDKDFVIIGKVAALEHQSANWSTLLALPNVHYKGIMTPKEFYPILKQAYCGLIVYTAQKRTYISSPLKVLNYLIAGLPVITNLDCEMEELHDKCLYYRKELDEFTNVFHLASRNELQFNEELVEDFLNKHSIKASIAQILAKL